jgi:hypothetical protein
MVVIDHDADDGGLNAAEPVARNGGVFAGTCTAVTRPAGGGDVHSQHEEQAGSGRPVKTGIAEPQRSMKVRTCGWEEADARLRSSAGSINASTSAAACAFYASIAKEGLRPMPHVVESIERNGVVVYHHDPKTS